MNAFFNDLLSILMYCVLFLLDNFHHRSFSRLRNNKKKFKVKKTITEFPILLSDKKILKN